MIVPQKDDSGAPMFTPSMDMPASATWYEEEPENATQTHWEADSGNAPPSTSVPTCDTGAHAIKEALEHMMMGEQQGTFGVVTHSHLLPEADGEDVGAVSGRAQRIEKSWSVRLGQGQAHDAISHLRRMSAIASVTYEKKQDCESTRACKQALRADGKGGWGAQIGPGLSPPRDPLRVTVERFLKGLLGAL